MIHLAWSSFLLIFLTHVYERGVSHPHHKPHAVPAITEHHSQGPANWEQCEGLHSAYIEMEISDIVYEILFHPRYVLFDNSTGTPIKSPTFYARTLISFTVDEMTSKIALNIAPERQYRLLDLQITSSMSRTSNTLHELTQLTFLSMKRCNALEILTLELNRQLAEGERVQLEFSLLGNITTPPFDLDFSGEQSRFMLVTEPINMRKVFPCFDEPRYRAHFQVSVLRPLQLFSLSNMPVWKTVNVTTAKGECFDDPHNSILDDANNYECDIYPMSRYAMSTYLFSVYLATKGIQMSQMEIRDDLRLQIYYNPSTTSTNETALFLNQTQLFIQFFEDYFNLKFPGEVMQNVVINMEFGEGEETWNLVAYNRLFVQRCSKSIIAHEVIHHWIGNLLSIDAWRYLWIKESTVEFLSKLYGTSPYFQWPKMNRRYYSQLLIALLHEEIYQLRNAPIEVTLNTKHDIEELFSYRAYAKGPFLLFVLQETILNGEEEMRRAIRKMLHDKKGDSITPEEFWGYFDSTNVTLPANISEIMGPFFQASGLPLVTLQFTPSDSHENILDGILSFQPFRLYPQQPVDDFWEHIKVNIHHNNQLIGSHWLRRGEKKHFPFKRPVSPESYFITINKNYSNGFYLSHYPYEVYEEILTKQLIVPVAKASSSFLEDDVLPQRMSSEYIELSLLITSGYERNMNVIMLLLKHQLESAGVIPTSFFRFASLITSLEVAQRLEKYILETMNATNLKKVHGSIFLSCKKSLVTSEKLKNFLKLYNTDRCSPMNFKSFEFSDMENLASILFHQSNETFRDTFLSCYLNFLLNVTRENEVKVLMAVDIVDELRPIGYSDPYYLLRFLLGNIHTMHMVRDAIVALWNRPDAFVSQMSEDFSEKFSDDQITLLQMIVSHGHLNAISRELCDAVEQIFDSIIREQLPGKFDFLVKGRESRLPQLEQSMTVCHLQRIHQSSLSTWLEERGY